MLKTSKQLLEPSLPFLLTIPFSFSLFSLLNCKYQVPFILFCYYIVLVFFFFLSSRPAQQRRDCLSSVAVCKYNFISVPSPGGKNRTKCFIFILSPSISLFITSLFCHKCCHDFYLLYHVCWVLGCFFLSSYSGKLEGIQLFFNSIIPCVMQNITSKILYSDPDVERVFQISNLRLCMHVQMPIELQCEGNVTSLWIYGDTWEGRAQISVCVLNVYE